MTSTNSSNPPNFPEDTHFDGTNYITFRNRVMIAARARGARGYLDGTIKKPETRPDTKPTDEKHTEWSSRFPSEEEWEERDAWTLGLIIYNTKNPVGLGIRMDGMAADTWKALTENYGVFSEITAMNAEKRLRSTDFVDGMDFLKHIEDLREKWRSAVERGTRIDDATFWTILIASLPKSWNAVVAGVYAKTESKDVIAALTTHWDRLVSQKQKAGVSATALQAQTKSKLVCINPNYGGSSHMSVYFLTRKDSSTTLTALSAYHVESEQQTGRKLKEVRVDAGREWVNEMWTMYLGEHGIILQVTTLYAHAQNGLVERANRTILEGVCCMLAESGLPKELWAEAAAAQIYMRNLLPTSRHPGIVPKESWTGKRQRVDHLRPWGCLAWAKVPEELVKSKLDPRSVRTRLVGYVNSGYRLYNQGSRTIVTSRDVIFEEGKGHQALTILDADEEENHPLNTPTPANTTPGLLPIRQPIAPRIRPDSGPLHPHPDLTPDVAPEQEPTPPGPTRCTIEQTANQPVQQSSRLSRPTPALIAAQEMVQRE
ncbi:hypothetical protein E4T56_gene13428 [Termitomyces sp. T112]|nr:hypothetical protein E4T56_gene13428 [Termitomyces sp. T112]